MMKTTTQRFRRFALGMSFLWSLALFAESADSSAYEGPKEDLHVYLLIGQSNMAGRAPFTPEEAKPIAGCFLLNADDSWEAATNPLNRHSTIRKGLGMQKMNPGYYFSKVMLEKNKGISLGLVVNAKGGTKIEQWAKGTRFYADAIKRTEAARKTGVLKGILWHQGESNNGNPEAYLKQLMALVSDLRKEFGTPELPFIAGQVINLPPINDEIAKLPEAVPFTAFASSEGLKGQDRWHFDAASMKLLGERYAEAVMQVQAKAPKE